MSAGGMFDLRGGVTRLQERGIVRLRAMPDGSLRVARPKGHPVARVVVIDPLGIAWRDDGDGTEGDLLSKLCQHLGIEMADALQTMLEGGKDPE